MKLPRMVPLVVYEAMHAARQSQRAGKTTAQFLEENSTLVQDAIDAMQIQVAIEAQAKPKGRIYFQ